MIDEPKTAGGSVTTYALRVRICELRMRTGKSQVCAAARPQLDKPMAFMFDNAGGEVCVSRR
jgi:hypothetical protein